MKLAILSDIHANLEALQATLADISRERVDQIVCLGDIVGYNANPGECISLLREFDPVCVAGNHDRAVCGEITPEGFTSTAARAVEWTRSRLGTQDLAFLASLPLQANIGHHLVAVHGALHPDSGCESVRLDSDERRLLSFEALTAHPSGARVCAFGHTHQPGTFELRNGTIVPHTGDQIRLREDTYYLVNPGTVGQPRTADRRASYLVLDTVRRSLTFRRVDYDASIPLAKTRKAGLMPPFSAVAADVLKRSARLAGVDGALKRMLGRR